MDPQCASGAKGYRSPVMRFPPGLGFEPRYSASKADVLPLDDPGGKYTTIFQMFDLTTVFLAQI